MYLAIPLTRQFGDVLDAGFTSAPATLLLAHIGLLV